MTSEALGSGFRAQGSELRGSAPDAPAAIHSAQDWLLRLGSLLGNLWRPVTENTGVSIDPDGQPKPQQQDGDTGKSIDPNG